MPFVYILNRIFLVFGLQGFRPQQPQAHLATCPQSPFLCQARLFFLMPYVTREGLSIRLTLQQLFRSKSREVLVTKQNLYGHHSSNYTTVMSTLFKR